jgi:hypothetical protein
MQASTKRPPAESIALTLPDTANPIFRARMDSVRPQISEIDGALISAEPPPFQRNRIPFTLIILVGIALAFAIPIIRMYLRGGRRGG